MDTIITTLLQNTRVGEPVGIPGATLVPVFANLPSGPDYITLDQAIAAGTLIVTEVDANGRVPELVATNEGSTPVLMLDGEELMGAKQNRVLNTTLLLAPGKQYKIPVSCVEQGRWNALSLEFLSSGNHATHRLRARSHLAVAQNVRAFGVHQADQGEVWDEVDTFSVRHGVRSDTGAMRDVYEERAEETRRAVEHAVLVEGQNGLLAVSGGTVLGLDVVSRPGAYAKLHDKLVRSYAIDVTPMPDSENDDAAIAKAFIASLGELVASEHDSPGMGRSHQYTSEAVVGSALSYRGKLVHAAFFTAPTDREAGGRSTSGRIHRPSPFREGLWLD